MALFWNLGFLHIPNYVIGFKTNKGNSLCVFILCRINGNLLCVFTLWWINGNKLIFRSLKIHHVLIFLAGSSSVPIMVEGSASPLVHTWLIESEVLPWPYLFVMIEKLGERETVFPTANSAYYYRPLILARYHSRSPALFPYNSAYVLRFHIYSSQHTHTHTHTHIYIYIYIYHHHHHVAPSARISLTVSRHFSLSLIASGRSSGLQPVSSHSCCM